MAQMLWWGRWFYEVWVLQEKWIRIQDRIPTTDIVIADCGEIKPGQDWGINDNDETNESLPPFPQDWEHKFKEYTPK
ncbi:peptidyl-prolyl cis-trans isomerase D-like [Musca autumnalis]|uniref:peptidyl-prolyl cis-trans isomerase D-like n=1 Tax=Musca autumnalis TaxID=221902 RepID=UPI003CF4B3BF